MALNDAIDEMRAYAARGRIGEGGYAAPSLRLDVTARITRGGVAFVRWQATNMRETTLVINRAGVPPLQFRVPPRGWRKLSDLPVGRHTVLLRARPIRQRGNEAMFQEAAAIEVVHPAPTIEFAVPRRIVLGATLRLSWRIRDAQQAELATSHASRPIELEDAIEMRPPRCGALRLTIRAVGAGGATEQSVSVDVAPPPVVLDIPARIDAEIGEDIAVRYAVSGAVTLTLNAPDRDEPIRALPFAGRIEIDEIMESERLILTAVGHDGRVHSKVVSVHVLPMAMPSIDDFLEILNGRP